MNGRTREEERAPYGGNICERSLSVFFFSSSNCVVRSLIKSSRLFEYCSNILNIVSTMFTFLGEKATLSLRNLALRVTYFPPLSNLIDWARSLNEGRVSACSAQHCFIELMYSGGATCFETEGRNRGGGFLIFAMISRKDRRKSFAASERPSSNLEASDRACRTEVHEGSPLA